MNLQDAKDFIFHQHDVVCNQKYNKTLPYSFHLDCVLKQGEKFKHLIEDVKARPENMYSNERLRDWVLIGCLGHDLIEDSRMTYNDCKDLFIKLWCKIPGFWKFTLNDKYIILYFWSDIFKRKFDIFKFNVK